MFFILLLRKEVSESAHSKLKSQLASTQMSLDEAKLSNAQLNDEIGRLTAEVGELAERLDVTEIKLQESLEEKETLSKSLTAEQERSKQFQKDIDILERQSCELRERVQETEAKVHRANSQKSKEDSKGTGTFSESESAGGVTDLESEVGSEKEDESQEKPALPSGSRISKVMSPRTVKKKIREAVQEDRKKRETSWRSDALAQALESMREGQGGRGTVQAKGIETEG